MLHCTRRVPALLSLWLACIYFAGRSFADDVPLPLTLLRHPGALGYSGLEIFVLNFYATVVIEYLVICALLRWPEKATAKLIFWVLLINGLTNPAAQFGATFFARVMRSEASAWGMICMVEIAVVVVEFGLLRCILGRMYRQGALKEPVTAKRTIMIAAAANAASFAFGFVGLVFVLLAMSPLH